MEVKLLVPICGPEGSYKIGEEVNLSHFLAKALIRDKCAVALDVPPKKVEIYEPEIMPEKPKKEEPLKRKSTRQRR